MPDTWWIIHGGWRVVCVDRVYVVAFKLNLSLIQVGGAVFRSYVSDIDGRLLFTISWHIYWLILRGRVTRRVHDSNQHSFKQLRSVQISLSLLSCLLLVVIMHVWFLWQGYMTLTTLINPRLDQRLGALTRLQKLYSRSFVNYPCAFDRCRSSLAAFIDPLNRTLLLLTRPVA